MGMRWLRLRLGTLTYEDWLLFCFTAGNFCGTAAALAFGGPTVQGCILGAAGSFGSGNRGVKEYVTVFRQRALETCGGWLAGVTVCSQMLFGFLTFYAGMSLAVVLSVLTIRKGLLGIAAFLCTVLPHGLVYLLVWYMLSGWSGQIQKKLHILPGLLLLIITGAGAFLEVFVSPFPGGFSIGEHRIQRINGEVNMEWLLFAFGSAVFAGLTAVLSKIGVRDTDSDLATAVRTAVVLVFSWIMVFLTGSAGSIGTISAKTCLFLVLSGVATGASWLFYFRALQLGDVNKVAPIDKSSTILTMFLAALILGEGLGGMKILCMALIGTGTLMMIQKRNQGVENTGSSRWLGAALLSAVFASLTAILGKIGIQGVNPTWEQPSVPAWCWQWPGSWYSIRESRSIWVESRQRAGVSSLFRDLPQGPPGCVITGPCRRGLPVSLFREAS